jgi:hypothetical protein
MAKQRGRQKKSVEQVREAYRVIVNGAQLDGSLKLLFDPASGRCGVYRETGEGDFVALIAGVSGNTFVDAMAIMRILLAHSDGNFLRAAPVDPVDLSDTPEQ